MAKDSDHLFDSKIFPANDDVNDNFCINYRYMKPIDYSKMKPFTNDELGLDNPERRQFV